MAETTNRISEHLDAATLGDGDELKKAFDGDIRALLAYRKRLVDQVDAVDDLLVGTVKQIQEAVAGPQQPTPQPQSRAVKGEARARGYNATRNGRVTDTSKVVDILKRNGKEMTRAELVKETEKVGIVNPESALYSLRVSGLIERKDGVIKYLGD